MTERGHRAERAGEQTVPVAIGRVRQISGEALLGVGAALQGPGPEPARRPGGGVGQDEQAGNGGREDSVAPSPGGPVDHAEDLAVIHEQWGPWGLLDTGHWTPGSGLCGKGTGAAQETVPARSLWWWMARFWQVCKVCQVEWRGFAGGRREGQRRPQGLEVNLILQEGAALTGS
ncbi:hypothetical protein H1C71_032552 [Ictidomys tridecemlineatus]|nr:hypothetical protein H1C71_032552 [Ictidomys tridecemlineatus]